MKNLEDLKRILRNVRTDKGKGKLYLSLFVIFHAESIKELDTNDKQELVSAIGWSKDSTSELNLFCDLSEYVEPLEKAHSIMECADR